MLPSFKKFQAYTLRRLDTDELKKVLRARKVSGAFEKRAPGIVGYHVVIGNGQRREYVSF